MADLKISQLQAHTTPIDNDLLAIVDVTGQETKKIVLNDLKAIFNAFDLSSLSATSPLNYDNTTGEFGIDKADTSTDGYLSSTDWNTFNGKQASLGFTPEDVTNKENATIDTSTTKYPTVNLLKTGLDAKIDKSIVNAKGDIITATADDTPARLPVGTDGQVLTADSNESTGLKYTTPLSASSTDTLTNKRINNRIQTQTSTSSLTFDRGSYDVSFLTAQAAALTIANSSNTNVGDSWSINILDNGTSRALTFGTDYVGIDGQALPTATTVSKWMELIFTKVAATKVLTSYVIEA